MKNQLNRIFYFLALITFGVAGTLAQADELKIYIIKPKLTIDWSSPRNLAITSAINSAGNDYAPIGHFAVEVNCSGLNAKGIDHILTGMERQSKTESRQITLKQGLGLGSLTYTFKGALQSSEQSLLEIAKAKENGRLKVLRVPTSPLRCQQMLSYMKSWIEHGSYQNYGGGTRASVGEGAGCADFAMEFFKIATQGEHLAAWSSHVKIPNSLMGSPRHKVGFHEILLRNHWAPKDEAGTDFKSPDTNMVWNWLEKKGLKCGAEYLWVRHAFPQMTDRTSDDCKKIEIMVRKKVKTLPTKPLAEFRFHYDVTEMAEVMWSRVETF
jgi:hypothetical protein